MSKTHGKNITFRTAVNRMRKVHDDLNLALLNPALFKDASFENLKAVADQNLKYLQSVEKLLDKQLSQVGSLISQYKETSSKIEAAKTSEDKYSWCGDFKNA